jgi:hypothetical protein
MPTALSTRWIDLMLMLPTRSNRISRRAFVFVLGIGIGTVVATALSVSGVASQGAAMLAGGLVILGLAIAAWLFPYDIALPYRAWNRIARSFSRYAARYVTAVLFWTVFRAIAWGPKPTRFEAVPQRDSTWRSRGTQPSETYGQQHNLIAAPTGSHGPSGLRTWMNEAGPHLGWTLIPFLALLRALNAMPHDGDAADMNIYTLY